MRVRDFNKRYGHLLYPAALLLMGPENLTLSGPDERRWGTNGSFSLALSSGAWCSFEETTAAGTYVGGGLKEFLRWRGIKNHAAWLLQHFSHADRANPPPHIDVDYWTRFGPGLASGQKKPRPKKKRRAVDGDGMFTTDAEGWREVARWIYVDELGAKLYQTRRYEMPREGGGKPRKTFRQYQPNGRGGWKPGLDEVARRVPFNLRGVMAAVADGVPVYIVEGEGKADALSHMGKVATCCALGCKSWESSWDANWARYFKGADIIIVPDNDEAGMGYATAVARSLKGVAARIRLLKLPDLPEKGDIVDWLKGVAANG